MNENQPQTTTLPESAFAFYGSHSRTVDAKGRFNLPFAFLRGASGPEEEKFMACKGPDGSLTLLPFSVWEDNCNRLRQQQNAGPALRKYIRQMNKEGKVVAPDSQGRVAVSKEFLAKFGIDKKIMIVGVGSHMELWDPDLLEDDNVEVDGTADFDNQFFR